MLKQITINRQRLPVPVPVEDLEGAVRWVSESLVKRGAVITRLTLDGQEIPLGETTRAVVGRDGAVKLSPESRLELSVDTPFDLCLQTVDATKNLTLVMRGSLKTLAVECWSGGASGRPPAGVEALRDDLELTCDLLDHLAVLVSETEVDAKAFLDIRSQVRQVVQSAIMAQANADWRAYARLLLNRLEPLIKELAFELDALQSELLRVHL